MVLEQKRVKVESLIKDAVTSLCAQSFTFRDSLHISGEIVVTVDSSDEFSLDLGSLVCAEIKDTKRKDDGLIKVIKSEEDTWQNAAEVSDESEDEKRILSTPKLVRKRGRRRLRGRQVTSKSRKKVKSSITQKEPSPEKELSVDIVASDDDWIPEGGQSSDADSPKMEENPSLVQSDYEPTPKRRKASVSTPVTPKEKPSPDKRRSETLSGPHPKPSKEDGIFKCPLCSFEDASRKNTMKHIRSHNRYIHVCELCDKCFDVKGDLIDHIEENHKGKPFPCGICDKPFPDRPGLWSHKYKIHKFRVTPRVSTTNCNSCDYTNANIPELLRHMESHITSKFQCDLCGKACSSKEKLQNHMENLHADDNYTCNYCYKECKSKQGLEHHKSMIHQDEIPAAELLSCWNCEFKTSLEKYFKLHMTAPDGNQWTCLICHDTVPCKKLLKEHMKEWHPDDSKKIICPICAEIFYTKNNFYKHKLKQHGITPETINQEKFKCTICKKEFPEVKFLKRHVRSHDQPEPYECPKCHRRFQYYRSCVIHLEACSENPGFPCLICDKRLKTEYAVVTHMRNMHNDTDAFKCQKCEKGFRNKYNLQKHEATCRAETIDSEETSKPDNTNNHTITVKEENQEKQFSGGNQNETFDVEIEFLV